MLPHLCSHNRHLEYLMLCWDLIVRHPAAHVTQQREANSWQKHRFLVNKCSSKHHRSLGWHVWKHNIKSSLEFGSGEELVSPAFRNRWCDKWGQGRDQLVHVNKASTLCSCRLIVRKKVITVRKKNRPTCLHPLPQVSASAGGSNSWGKWGADQTCNPACHCWWGKRYGFPWLAKTLWSRQWQSLAIEDTFAGF